MRRDSITSIAGVASSRLSSILATATGSVTVSFARPNEGTRSLMRFEQTQEGAAPTLGVAGVAGAVGALGVLAAMVL